MASIAWGSKLVVRSGDVAVSMRSLRSVDITGSGWAIPVIADLDRLMAAGLPGRPAVVDLTTDAGQMQVDVEIVAADGDLLLRAPKTQPSRALRPASLTDQRRENVRGPVRLGFRGTTLEGRARPGAGVVRGGVVRGGRRGTATRRPLQKGMLAAMGPGPNAQADLVGSTVSVSAGGLSVDLDQGAPVTAGGSVYGEITLPGGDLVPAMMIVVEETGKGFRAEFTDISPMDSERLVRLVFHRQRGEMAGRP